MTKHGHGLPRKRPGRSAKDAIDAQLPELEPLEEIPELEPIDDLPMLEEMDEEELEELEELEADEGPVKATCADSDEDGFDTTVTVDVPDMPKPEVLDAVRGPLARIAGSYATSLRHRKVLVRFTGDGMVGSAVKQLVADQLAVEKPLLVVVKRGFGDETVHEGCLPTVEVSSEAAADATEVTVRTGECEQVDLPTAMAEHVVALVEAAQGVRFVFRFVGGVKPDSATREALANALRDGGARSVAVGARVMFDRDVEDRVQCSTSDADVTVTVELDGGDEDVVDGLSLALGGRDADFAGKRARFQLARESAAVQRFCVDFARAAGATLVEIGDADGLEIVWPPLIEVRAGKEVSLVVTTSGRSRDAVLSAFASECVGHQDATAGKDVVVDWPAGFDLDQEAVAVLERAAEGMSPRGLSCTISGEGREPFVPPPVHFGVDGDLKLVIVESEAGKPKELQRALDRRLPAALEGLRGAPVRVDVRGGAALSRTLRQNLIEAIASAGVTRLEIAEDGDVDVLLPPLLAVTNTDSGVTISCVMHGRSEDQLPRTIARELEGVEVALQHVKIHDSVAARLVAEHVLELGAATVLLDGEAPVRLHPPLLEALDKKGKQARLCVEPTGDDDMDARMVDAELADRLKSGGILVGVTVTVAWPGGLAASEAVQKIVSGLREKKASKVFLESGEGEPEQLHPQAAPAPAEPEQPVSPAAPPVEADSAASLSSAPTGQPLVRLLGKLDGAAPPMVVIGVADGDDNDHMLAVVAELQEVLPKFQGRAVLLVMQRDGQDVPLRRATSLFKLLAQIVPQAAAATLIFRGPDDQGRDHFEVLHSAAGDLSVGAAYADPRRS